MGNRRTLGCALLAIALLAATGCGEDTTVAGNAAAADQISLSDLPLDSLAGDDLAAPLDVEPSEPDAPPDQFGIDVGYTVVPCAKNEDCPTQACLDTPDGKQCGQTCLSSCPPDFSCQQVAGSGDVLFLCTHLAPYRCLTCSKDSDCDLGTGNKGECADFGQGGFCLQPCGGGKACAGQDFTCEKGFGTQELCVPPGKQCPCPDGKSGMCKVKNEFGACPGSYACAAGKPGACAGVAPMAEQCNLKDDNCDGATDENVVQAECDLSNVYGACKGKALCVAGQTLCQGTAASAETCNGIDDNCGAGTDEGFTDTDGDAKADCVDPDDDDDGVLDAADDCTVTLNAGQTDTDSDGLGDACDPDDDNDKSLDGEDNCPLDVTPDNCPAVADPSLSDLDADGAGDACDADIDGDGLANAADNCPATVNADQANTDKDGQGDACDDDDDNDGALDVADNCPLAANPTQTDQDGDNVGNVCDDDLDGDSVANLVDNCPGKANPDQVDVNANKVGDACESDWDSDGVLNAVDNCPWAANPAQTATDGDELGDACDCDADADGIANPALGCPDVVAKDNCALTGNADQKDLDNDGLGDACDGDLDGDGDANSSDCKPADKAISLLAKEICNDIDDNCDGAVDEANATGCKPYYFDEDGDGAGVTLVMCLCAATPPYSASAAGDCNDQDGTVNPKAKEICANGKDDNCNGSENDIDAVGCKAFFVDADDDGYGTAASQCLCTNAGDYSAKQAGDCNDANSAVNPGQMEKCADKLDNNCNASVDETGCLGCTTYYKDVDGDGFGLTNDKQCLSSATSPYNALKPGDCNDALKAVSPAAPESCNKVDDDCDSQTDEINATGCKVYYQDEDKDTFGTGSGQCACGPTGLMTAATAKDCNDKDAAVNPSKAEICGNAKDDNCAGGETEENAVGCAKLYLDGDADGYGAAGFKCLCGALGTYTAKQGGDCNDADAARAPNLGEKCQDKKDNDCDGAIDEENCLGCLTLYKDVDADGYGLTSDKKCLNAAAVPYSAAVGGDCLDSNKAVNPKATEACNALDDNCNGATDEENATGCKVFFTDEDKDTFGIGTSKCFCAAGGLFTASKDGDCNDKDLAVNPSKAEVCGNGKDDNCANGENDLSATGCVNYFVDMDGDGYGVSTAKCTCAPQGNYTAKQAGDCDDTATATSPAQTEKCLDSKDNNCDGKIDEAGCQGCTTYYKDADQDSYGLDADKQCLGAAKYPYTAYLGGDCNDDPAKNGASQKPSAAELCNSIDDNCDGQTDPTGTSGCQFFYPDVDKDTYGAQVSAMCLCTASATYSVTKTGDCSDSDAAINPGKAEVCDGKDNNCNASIDEGVLITFFKDQDADTYGGVTTAQACTAPSGYAAKSGDCNDFNGAINPGKAEVCNDLDDDCDSLVDEGIATQTVYKDNDGDKFAPLGGTSMKKCNVPVGWTTAQDINADAKFDWDCDDSDVTTHPGAADTCGDGKDNDCNGSVDKLCYTACDGAWPFQLKFSSSNSAARPVDLDGDGNYEVVVQDSFGFAILTTLGAPLYDYSAAVYNFSDANAAYADVDSYNSFGAGTQGVEVITANGGRARIYKVNIDGTVSVIENTANSVIRVSRNLVADFDYDGAPELVYHSVNDKIGSKIFRFDTKTGLLNLVSTVADPDGVPQYYAHLLTDLDGDGVVDLVAGNGYPGTGGYVETAAWAGKIYAYKLTDAAKAVFAPTCTPIGTCAFNTAIAKLNGVYIGGIYRFGNEIQASAYYSPTKVVGQNNAAQAWHWRFGLDGKALAGSPSTTTSIQFPTDVDDDGVVETNGYTGEFGLWDVDGDGYPDQVYTAGTELRVALWVPAKKAFVEHVPSRAPISSASVGLRGIADMNGDGRLDVTVADSAGKVFCQQLGAATFVKKSSLPPYLPAHARTNQWDNYEPNTGADTNADGMPDRVIRVPSSLTRKGNFYSYVSSATDKDYYVVDTAWGGNICLTAPKGRSYSLKVFSYTDKWNNASKAAGADGKVDGLLWTGTTTAGGTTCFNGNSVIPFRYGEYKFAIGVESVSGFSPYWPYWITAAK